MQQNQMHDHHVIIEAFNAIQYTIYKALKNMQTQPEFSYQSTDARLDINFTHKL